MQEVGGPGGVGVGTMARIQTKKKEAAESHYLKVIRKCRKGQWWTCNAEGIM